MAPSSCVLEWPELGSGGRKALTFSPESQEGQRSEFALRSSTKVQARLPCEGTCGLENGHHRCKLLGGELPPLEDAPEPPPLHSSTMFPAVLSWQPVEEMDDWTVSPEIVLLNQAPPLISCNL